MTIRQALAEVVREHATEREINLASLARSLGVSRQTAWNIHTGRSGVSVERLVQIGEVFHVGPDELLCQALAKVNKGS